MGAAASSEAVVLHCLHTNDARRLREHFARGGAPAVLLRPLTREVLQRVAGEGRARLGAPPLARVQEWVGQTPLHVAAARRDARILAEMLPLVAAAPPPGLATRDAAGFTPLSRAVNARAPAAARLLLAAGASPDEAHSQDARSPAAWSHVRHCAAAGVPDVLRVLLRHGADCHEWGADGRRPVHLAVEAGHLECVKALLEADGVAPRGVKAPPPSGAKRIRAVANYVLRECTVPHAAEPVDPSAAPAPGVAEAATESGDESATVEVDTTAPAPPPDVRGDILSALQTALQDAVRGMHAAAAAPERVSSYRSNRDRGATLLHLASAQAHAHVLRYLLTLDEFAGAIEDMNDSGKSAIFMAIRHGSLECLKILITAGARVDSTDIENWTALHEAVKAGDDRVDILQYLIEECEIDINAVDDDGWTALHVAARFSSEKAVDILVKAGCDIDAKTEDNETAVLLASAQATSAEVLRKLLQNGADLSVHRDTALTPSRLILGRKDFDQLCILLDHLKTLDEQQRTEVIDLESRSETGDTLLHLCVLEKNAEASAKLLAVGAKPDEKNHDLIASLHTASKNGNADIAEALLKAKGDPNIVRGDGMMPLHIACDSGHADVVDVLIKHGADVNRCVSQSGRYRGFSPLMFAARLGDGEVTTLVIKAGADMNLRKADGFTALHLAALNGNTVACRNLIEAGADYRVADETGYFPLQLATRHNQFDVVSTMLQANVKADSCGRLGLTALHIASFICDARLIWLLIRGGANVNAVNSDNATPLHVAAGREQGRVSMQLLLANGAKLDVLDNEQDTALHNACYKGLYQNVRLLLRRGAHASPENENQVTPLHLAAAVGSEETVEALLKYGAGVDKRDSNGKTPYRVASEHNNRKAMILLFRAMGISLEEIAPRETFGGGDSPRTSADEVLCVICQTALLPGEEVRTLPCQHTYHDACIMAWLGGEELTRHDSCPLCQKSVLPESSSPRLPSS